MFPLPKSAATSPLGHSADVELYLHVSGRTLPRSQTGNHVLKLSEEVPVPNGPAHVEIITDGISHFSDVTILGGKPNALWLNIE